MTYRSSKLVRARRKSTKNFFKGTPKKPKHVFFTCSPRPPTLSQRHMDLHVWAYPRPDYIFQVSSKSISEPQRVKIWPFPLLWLVAFTTACTTVQAVISDHLSLPFLITMLSADWFQSQQVFTVCIFFLSFWVDSHVYLISIISRADSFSRKILPNLRLELVNSTAHHTKIVQILRLNSSLSFMSKLSFLLFD